MSDGFATARRVSFSPRLGRPRGGDGATRPLSPRTTASRAIAALAVVLAGCVGVLREATPTADLPRDGGAAGAFWADGSVIATSVVSPDQAFVLTTDGIDRLALNPLGLARLAVPTIGAGEMRAPRDLDATNGQDLYVADGARVLRYSGEGRLVQTLNVPSVDALLISTAPVAPPGEAVAVAAGVEGTVYVAEATRGVVQVWRDGALADVFGGLGRPVSLAARGRTLYVADAASGVVRVLDDDGRELRVWRDDALASIVSVSLSRDRVVILASDAVVLVSAEGDRQRVVPVSGGAALLDAAVVEDRLLVLTASGVYDLGRLD